MNRWFGSDIPIALCYPTKKIEKKITTAVEFCFKTLKVIVKLFQLEK